MNTTCDIDLLRRSLADRLSEGEEDSLGRHLTTCASCQRELERLAGDEGDWSKVRVALRSEADSASGSSLCSSMSRTADSEDLDEESAIDFAVDFLEPSSATDAIGRLGEIDILELIGRGGMGVVLKGFQPELKRLVAVKVLAPHLAVSGPARRRFAREAQAVAAILHPNVMPILSVHSNGKLPYLVMPFLACESLQQRIERHGPLDTVDVLRIGLQTAKGLAAAHAQGIVHRDVKPANILLERGVERVMLTDFGLARAVDDAQITRTGLIAGTPQYMSPEQIRGEVLDARSDLFSLGSVLYTMATGRPAFRAESTYGILRRITDDAPRSIRELNPQIPDWLERLIGRLLEKSRDARFSSAEEVGQLLEQCLAHVQQPMSVPLPNAVAAPVEPQAIVSDHAQWRHTGKMIAAFIAVAMVALVWFTISRSPHFSWVAANTEYLGVDTPDRNEPVSESIQSEVDDAENSTSAPPALSTDGDTDWNSVPRDLNALFDEAQSFEDRVKRFWNDEPDTEQTNAPLDPPDQADPPLEQEITP